MKKLLYLMAIASFVACTNDEEMNLLTETMPEESVSVEKRSFQEALEVAQNAPEIFGGTTTRGELKQVTLADTQYIISDASTRNDAPDTLMYVFNYEDNQGFAVVSANKSTEALIAVTEQGNYNEETEIDNPGFGMYMDMAEQYVSARGGFLGPNDTLIIFREHKIEIDTTEIIRINPKVMTRWGQTGYEATYTPNGYSGCSNTAMAQIMTYFCHPTQLTINYSNATISSLSLNWDEIKTHNISHSKQLCNANENAHTTIGHLLRQLGAINKSDYLTTGTSTYADDVINSFSSLGYSTSTLTNYSGESIYSQLAENKLFYMRGSRLLENGTYSGHAWIVDGYLKHRIIVSEWSRIANLWGAEWELISEGEPYYTEYYHINWGWDGNCNGYFKNEVFETNKAIEYDNINSNFNNQIQRNYKYIVKYFTVTR